MVGQLKYAWMKGCKEERGKEIAELRGRDCLMKAVDTGTKREKKRREKGGYKYPVKG